MGEYSFRTVRGYQLLEQHKNSLTPSLEDYLEMIYREIKREGFVRAATLASMLNVKPPSASKMTHKLASLGFIEYQKYGIIQLTEHGEEVGEYLLWRHETLERFFCLISGAEDTFVEAELAEHVLGQETVQYLGKLVDFFEHNPDVYRKFKKDLV